MSHRGGISAIGIACLLFFFCARTADGRVNAVLAWDAPNDPLVTGYVVRYGKQPGTYMNAVDVGNVTSALVSGLSGLTTYYFVVQSYNASRVFSAPTPELAYRPFSDSPLTAGSAIKAVHITELRARIDAVRARHGLVAYPFIDPVLTAGTTTAKARHIIDLHTALAEAYEKANLPPPIYTTPSPAAGVPIRATDITEIRNAVIAIE